LLAGFAAVRLREPALPPPPPAPPLPSPNGFDLAMKAAGQMVRDREAGEALTGKTKDGKRVTYTASQQRQIADANRAALDTLHAAVALPYREPAPAVRDIDRPFPHYARFRALARVACLDGRVRWDAGDRRAAVDRFLDAVQFGRRMPAGGPLIPRLVGIACESLGRRQLWDHLEWMDATTARYAAAHMEAFAGQAVPFADTLEEERLYCQDALRDAFRTPSEAFGGPSDGAEGETDRVTRAENAVMVSAVLLKHGKAGVLHNLDEAMDRYVAASREPYARHPGPLAPPADPLSDILVSGVVHKSRVKQAASQAFDGLLRVALALRAYRLERGTYPSDLAALVKAGYLKSLPADPFSADGKSPFAYRRTPAGRYLLYSLGPDVRDDGGRAIESVSSSGKKTRFVEADSRGDIVAGINGY
jgi:hypothetical protein